jgi:SOS-response transcriptional repressor LexA
MNIAGVESEDVLRFIDEQRIADGYPPSRREIAQHFGIGLESTQRVLGGLIEEGLLIVTPGVSRAINITGTGMKIISENLT